MLRNYMLQESKIGKKNLGNRKTDYRIYQYSKPELLMYSLEGILIVLMLGYFFYRSMKWTCLLFPLVMLFLKSKKSELCKKRKQRLTLQFKEALNSINSSLQAGYSMENAFGEAYKDMAQYYGAGSMIAKELLDIKIGMQNGRQVEELVQDLGERSGIEDILDFGSVLMVGKRSGGNINEIIQSCVSVIEEKIDTKQEIQTILGASRLEAGIMSVIPFFIILYMEITSRGYFDALYQTIGGNILMTACLGIYVAAIVISRKIVNIDV